MDLLLSLLDLFSYLSFTNECIEQEFCLVVKNISFIDHKREQYYCFRAEIENKNIIT